MTGKVITTPDSPHRCFLFWPAEAGALAAVGTRWQCDDCHQMWELVKGKGWQRVLA